MPWTARLALFAAFFAFGVVLLGAYTRLSDAGLGCPDWPGCYGHLAVPQAEHEVARAQQAFPERPLEAPKAWKEMIHRYFAGTLGLLILALAAGAVAARRRDPHQPVALPVFILALVVFQALLGMWTVTWLLKPVVVMGHLLGGLSVLALLWWYGLRHGRLLAAPGDTAARTRLRGPALAALAVLALQIALGGWTSANYAALACTDFPTCGGQWWPDMDFSEAFVLWRGLGINYEFGVLDSAARKAIHVTHRLGAVAALLVVGWAAVAALRQRGDRLLARTGAVVLGLLLVQVSLGIANVVFSLPLPVAVAHNGGAALLLLSVVTLNHVVRSP